MQAAPIRADDGRQHGAGNGCYEGRAVRTWAASLQTARDESRLIRREKRHGDALNPVHKTVE